MSARSFSLPRSSASSGPVHRGSGRLRGFGVLLALGVLSILAAACGDQEDWSPLDGPWDPDDPMAPAILAAPAPDSPIDREMAEAGERWYRIRGCLACHSLDGVDVAGPTLQGVTRRRDYDWYRGMVMNPDSMLLVDPVAQGLLRMYRVPMPDQGLDELRTRAIWEYLRMLDGGGGAGG